MGPGFQVRGGVLKKIAPSGGYFMWKIMILCPKIIFFPILGAQRNCWGISCENHDFMPKNNFSGGGACAWILPCIIHFILISRVHSLFLSVLFLFLERKQDTNLSIMFNVAFKEASTKNSEPTYWTILVTVMGSLIVLVNKRAYWNVPVSYIKYMSPCSACGFSTKKSIKSKHNFESGHFQTFCYFI